MATKQDNAAPASPNGPTTRFGFASTGGETDKRQDDADDRLVAAFGYRPRFRRTLRSFDSFAVGFSFISITTGIFTTYGFVLSNAGPRGIWVWPVAVLGQILVALVYGTLVSRIPLAGHSYQWGSRLAGPTVGWWLGWIGFSYLAIITVSINYAFAQTAFLPLFGITYTPVNAALITLVVVALQAVMIIFSTPLTSKLNNFAVLTEILGVIQLVVVLIVASLAARFGDPSNLVSTGTVPAEGWFGWLGPVMLATLLGSYTITGWEASSDLAEETHRPRSTIPTAMVRSIVVSGVLGLAFLIALTIGARDFGALTNDSAPVASILSTYFGGARTLVLAWMCVSMFACGTVVMVANSRLAWAMARDRRLPGHQFLSRTPRITGGPLATILVASVSAITVILLYNNTTALFTLFTSATLLSVLLYLGTVLLYVAVRKRLPTLPGDFVLGKWERPVLVGAIIWLVYELIVLNVPDEFRLTQAYALGALGVGVVVYLLMLVLEPRAMRQRLVTEFEVAQKEMEAAVLAEARLRAATEKRGRRSFRRRSGTRALLSESLARQAAAQDQDVDSATSQPDPFVRTPTPPRS